MRTAGMEQRHLKSVHNLFWAHFRHFSFPELQALIIHSSGGWCFPEKRRVFHPWCLFPPQNLPKKTFLQVVFVARNFPKNVCGVSWLVVKGKKARWEQGGHPKCHQFNENSMEVFKLHSLFNKWEQKEKICDGCPIVSIIHWVWDPIIVLISKPKNGRATK